MSKHTPGPWGLEGKGLTATLQIIAPSGVVADLRLGYQENADEDQANARLIAAAPELLAELEKANRIIINALNVMTPASRRKWDERNEKQNLKDGWALTRNDAREKVIKKARGENA